MSDLPDPTVVDGWERPNTTIKNLTYREREIAKEWYDAGVTAERERCSAIMENYDSYMALEIQARIDSGEPT